MAISNLHNIFLEMRAWWERPLMRCRLKNKKVSIISNDCWGGFMYRYLHLPFRSPFIGLFIMPEDYVSLLSDPARLYAPLRFIRKSESRHLAHISHPQDYPVALLPTGEEIHFLHYPDAETAKAKWERRLKRLDLNNCIVKLSDNYYCTEQTLRAFDSLPYRQKVLFTARRHSGLQCEVVLPQFKKDGRTGERIHKVSQKYWDLPAHANSLICKGEQKTLK